MDNNKENTELQKREKFLNQNNSISVASIQSNSVVALKLITYAAYLLDKEFETKKYENINLFDETNWFPEMWSDFTCVVSTSRFCEDLGIKDGGRQRVLIEKALDRIFEEKICIADENISTYFPWFVKATYYHPKNSNYKSQNLKEGEDNNLRLVFHPGIIKLMLDNQKQYTHIKLKSLGQFKSIYAIKWYEIILSFYNMKGRYGNAPNTWTTNPMTIDELKELFNIKANLYKNRVNNLISRVLTKPIEEINNANVNFKVEIQFNRGFRNSINNFSLKCTEKCIPRIPEKNTSREDKSIMEEQNNTEQRIEYYKTKYPGVFAEKMSELNKDKSQPLPEFKFIQEIEVCNKLKMAGYN